MRDLVAIPIYNEAPTLQTVLRQVRRYARDILVIDDGSTDATPELLRHEEGIARIRHLENCGYGQSLIDAFRYAAIHDYDWVITMDCDEQHDPQSIPRFRRLATDGDVDIISGSRYLSELAGNSKPPPDRRAINEQITQLLNEVLNLELTDAFCGFKAYRVSAVQQLELTIPGYAMPIQLWVQAARAGLRICEIPVPRVYNDPNRHFGGSLDDPQARLLYYYDVLVHELGEQVDWLPAQQASSGAGCNCGYVCTCPET